jgi:hypothetical protein
MIFGKIVVLSALVFFTVLAVVANLFYDPKRDGRCDTTKCRDCPFPCEMHTKERK